MSTFVVNGQTVTAEKNKKLLRFLRDDLGLTSVKDGCSEGACGACTVIIDGVTCKACVPDTDKLEGPQYNYGRGPERLGKGDVHLRLLRGGGGAVRLLHTRHGDVHKSAAG